MFRITPHTLADLHDVAGTRRIEQALAATLPAHALMKRAGLAVARLAMAIAPHARIVWIACGPGNNGGDGFEAAAQLQKRGFAPVVTFYGDEAKLPADARAALARARDAGVLLASDPPARHDLAIDALLGIGSTRPPAGVMADWLQRMHASPAPVLCVDVPSGLDADNGAIATNFIARFASRTGAGARFSLSLLTLKPGLFTAHGRDAAGEVWFDDLGAVAAMEAPVARLGGAPAAQVRAHASNKGSYGDVAVVGGASGMAGAALLAGSGALHAGAGRVLVGLLDAAALVVDVSQPELMLRAVESLEFSKMAVVCGCGGGDAVRGQLPRVISTAASLVLDADALNAIAVDAGLQHQVEARVQRGLPTVLTPHPLEAARLLGISAADVQANRLDAARRLAARFGTVVLKGSGTVVVHAGAGFDGLPVINLTGNGRLATAGTGDVLAGMTGAMLASGRCAFDAACEAVWHHGDLADRWPADRPLTAGSLARGTAFQ